MTSTKDNLLGKRIAGIDFGTKRVGISVCDELHISVNPLCTLQTDSPTFFDDLKNIFANERITAVVIGLPETYDGTENSISKKIKLFAEKIRNVFEVDVYFSDESYSSKNAGGYMIDYGIRKKNRAKKGMIDKYAAVVILRQFLSEMES